MKRIYSENIRIAVIDTGLDKYHSFYTGKLKAFYDIYTDDMVKKTAPYDLHGHGTACAYIIDRHCSNDYDLYVFKIYKDQLQTKADYLIKALELCKEIKPNIINMSMGSVVQNQALERLCEQLNNMGCILVSSDSEDYITSCWPANYPFSIKVKGTMEREDTLYTCTSGLPFEMQVYSGDQKVAWLNGQYNIVFGNSFACAKATGLIAKSLSRIFL